MNKFSRIILILVLSLSFVAITYASNLYSSYPRLGSAPSSFSLTERSKQDYEDFIMKAESYIRNCDSDISSIRSARIDAERERDAAKRALQNLEYREKNKY